MQCLKNHYKNPSKNPKEERLDKKKEMVRYS
jgi:hypothetical protein